MRPLRRKLRIVMFLLGVLGLLGGSVPVAAQTLEQETLEANTEISVESTLDDRPTEAASPDSVSTSIELWASSEQVSTLTTILFQASGVPTQSSSIVGFAWDLDGDGVFEATSTEPSISRSYAQDGAYQARVQALTDDGRTLVSEPIVIEVLNRPPSASFSVSGEELTDISEVSFEVTSSDLDGEVVAWLWDLGDGTTSSERSPTHMYESSGTYQVSLAVRDDDGQESRRATQTIIIENSPPIAAFRAPASAVSGVLVRFTDASLDPSPNGRIVHVAWDYGDGVYEAGGPSSDGAYTHTYEVPGIYTVKLYVIDKDGVLSWVQSQIRVVGIQ